MLNVLVIKSQHCFVMYITTEDVDNKLLCKAQLSEADLTKLRDAIEDLYYFEFVLGKLLCVFV